MPRPRVAELARAIVAFPAIEGADEPVLLRALVVHEVHRLDFAAEYGIAGLWWMARILRTAPVSREMILNYVGEHSLRLPRSY